MTLQMENPAAPAGAHRVLNIAAIAKPLDSQNPTASPLKSQSELLAARSVMRRCRVSYWHALTICRLSGLGGAA
jgi:hypothetical protein